MAFPKFFKLDKRKNRRFIVDEHDLVLYDSDAPEDREIVDLSMGGISFVYVDKGKRPSEVFELDIKIGDTFHLGRVRVKTVSDMEIGDFTEKSKQYRRLSGKFLNLDPIQEYELKRILKKYGQKS